MASHKYKYQPLGPTGFRLLRILPGSLNAPIHIELVEKSIEQAGCFVALSYVWGAAEPSYKIFIGTQHLRIGQNLISALWRFRKQGILTVWADAVCINQGDLQERVDQVMSMRQIYESAFQVVIYLGEFGRDESHEIYALLELLYVFACRRMDNQGIPDEENLDWSNLRKYGLPEADDARWGFLIRLLAHPWFSRIWTIQESVFATRGRVIYGDCCIDQQKLHFIFYNLSKYPSFANYIDRTPRDEISPVRHAIQRCNHISLLQGMGFVGFDRATWHYPPLISLLVSTGRAYATDPRDYVFALLGISQEADEPALRPNYDQSKEQLYLQLSKYMVEKGYGLQLLHHASGGAHGINIPSWVPQWDMKKSRNVMGILEGGMLISRVFSAAGKSQPALCLSNDDKVLILRGIILDTIEQLGSSKYIPTTWKDLKHYDDFTVNMACLAETVNMLRGTEKYRKMESNTEVLSRLSTCDRPIFDRKASKGFLGGMSKWVMSELELMAACKCPIPGDFRENATLIAESVLKNDSRPNEPPLQDTQAWIYAKAFRATAASHTCNAIRCRTGNGYLCQVPVGSQTGDKLIIIPGCEVPFLLRPSHSATYSVVGNCYIHGIMYGEAWDENVVQEIRIS